MKYKYLSTRGALHHDRRDAATRERRSNEDWSPRRIANMTVPADVLALVPDHVVHEHQAMPLAFDGETITVAVEDPDDIALADLLRFTLAKDVHLVRAPAGLIRHVIKRFYPTYPTHRESVETLMAFAEEDLASAEGRDLLAESSREDAEIAARGRLHGLHKRTGMLKRSRATPPRVAAYDGSSALDLTDVTSTMGGTGMFFYVVEEGQQVLMRRPDGTAQVIVGPRRVWRWRKVFQPM